MSQRDELSSRQVRDELLAAWRDRHPTQQRTNAMTKAELYVQHLEQEGYKPRIDEDNDVIFKFEGMTLVLSNDDEDTPFFRLLLPNFWEIESEEEQQALRAMNAVNARLKVLKLVLVRGHVWASVELFFDPFETFKSVFTRSVRLVLQGAKEFRDEMNP